MLPVLNEPGSHPRATNLNLTPFVDNNFGFMDFNDSVQAAISADAAAPQMTNHALTA